MARALSDQVDLARLAIDRFQPSDQEAARALILEGMVEHWGTLDPALNRDLDDIATSCLGATFLVGRIERRVVATASLQPHAPSAGEGLVTRMAVAADLRHRGIGARMLDHLAEEARRLDLDRLVLETTTDWDDVVAFYLRCGFTVTHLEQGAWSSNTWFALDL